MSKSKELLDFLIERKLISDNGNVKRLDLQTPTKIRDMGLTNELSLLNNIGLEKYIENLTSKEFEDLEKNPNLKTVCDAFAFLAEKKIQDVDSFGKLKNNSNFLINSLYDEKYSDFSFKFNDTNEMKKVDENQLSEKKSHNPLDIPVSYKELHSQINEMAQINAMHKLAFEPEIKERNGSSKEEYLKNSKIVLDKLHKEEAENMLLQAYVAASVEEQATEKVKKKYSTDKDLKDISQIDIDTEIRKKISEFTESEFAITTKDIANKLENGKEHEIKVRPNLSHLSNILSQHIERISFINKVKNYANPKKLEEHINVFDKKCEKRFGKYWKPAKLLAKTGVGVGLGFGAALIGVYGITAYGTYRAGDAIRNLRKEYKKQVEEKKTDKSIYAWAFSSGGYKETMNVFGSSFQALGGRTIGLAAKSPKILSALSKAASATVSLIKNADKKKLVTYAAVASVIGVTTAALVLRYTGNDEEADSMEQLVQDVTDSAVNSAENAEILAQNSEAISLVEKFPEQTNLETLRSSISKFDGKLKNILGDTVKYVGNKISKFDSTIFNTALKDTLHHAKGEVLASNSNIEAISVQNNEIVSMSQDINTDNEYDYDYIEKHGVESNNLSRLSVYDSDDFSLSEKTDKLGDEFIGKELKDKLVERYNQNSINGYIGEYSKEEFIHKSAMIRAYSPVADKKYGRLLEDIANGKMLTASDEIYIQELLDNVDEEGHLYSDYTEAFANDENAQKIYDDIMNNPEKFAKDGYISRKDIFAKLNVIKDHEPDKFNEFLASYKTVEPNIEPNLEPSGVATVTEYSEVYDDKVNHRFVEALYKAHDPSSQYPIKAYNYYDEKLSKNVERLYLDYDKLSPEAKDVFNLEYKARATEQGILNLKTQNKDEMLKLLKIKDKMAFEAVKAFDASNMNVHENVYTDTIANNLEDKLRNEEILGNIPKMSFADTEKASLLSANLGIKSVGGLTAEQLIEKNGGEILTNGNGYLLCKLYDGRLHSYLNPDYLTDQEKIEYNAFVDKNSGENGSFDLNAVKADFLAYKMQEGIDVQDDISLSENIININSLNDVKYENLDVSSKAYLNKVRGLGKILYDGDVSGKEETIKGARSCILETYKNGTDREYGDDISKFCRHERVKINIDGQGYGQYKIPKKGILNYIDPENLTADDKVLYSEFSIKYSDHNGNIDYETVKNEFIREKTLLAGKDDLLSDKSDRKGVLKKIGGIFKSKSSENVINLNNETETLQNDMHVNDNHASKSISANKTVNSGGALS